MDQLTMGADITLVVEQRSGHGKWELAARPDTSSLDWYDDRAYECFSLLTGLDFSARKLRPLIPIAPLRGWPDDLSDDARSRLTAWSDDTAFGQSWLEVADFEAYDWNSPMTWTFMASPPRGLIVTDEVRSHVLDHVERHQRLPDGWGRAGWSRDGFEVTLRTTPREQAGVFLDVVRDMTALGADRAEPVRCVFEFTR
ncbi:MAG: hypothetical protein GY701_31135 [Sulfitobacter sp.]|nr:hypothetical protein [Sulfitobacter sp.]